MIWSIPTMWQFPELFLMFLPVTSHKQTSKIPDIRFYIRRTFPSFRPMGMVGKVCLMLIIRGRLITPFILGPMSVGLNILIRLRIDEFGLWLGYHGHNYFMKYDV